MEEEEQRQGNSDSDVPVGSILRPATACLIPRFPPARRPFPSIPSNNSGARVGLVEGSVLRQRLKGRACEVESRQPKTTSSQRNLFTRPSRQLLYPHLNSHLLLLFPFFLYSWFLGLHKKEEDEEEDEAFKKGASVAQHPQNPPLTEAPSSTVPEQLHLPASKSPIPRHKTPPTIFSSAFIKLPSNLLLTVLQQPFFLQICPHNALRDDERRPKGQRGQWRPRTVGRGQHLQIRSSQPLPQPRISRQPIPQQDEMSGLVSTSRRMRHESRTSPLTLLPADCSQRPSRACLISTSSASAPLPPSLASSTHSAVNSSAKCQSFPFSSRK